MQKNAAKFSEYPRLYRKDKCQNWKTSGYTIEASYVVTYLKGKKPFTLIVDSLNCVWKVW